VQTTRGRALHFSQNRMTDFVVGRSQLVVSPPMGSWTF